MQPNVTEDRPDAAVNGRSRADIGNRKRRARRRRAIITTELRSQLPAIPDALQPALRRAAELALGAEQARAALVRGDATVTIDQVVKLENLAARCVRELRQLVDEHQRHAGQAIPSTAELIAGSGAK